LVDNLNPLTTPESPLNTRVLVTGYGGFLGAAICRQLISQGYCVRGLARGTYRHLEQLGVETIRGSITDPKDVSAAMDRVDAVIHTAAIAGVWGPRATFESINISATENLLNEAKQRNVQAFVYTSSPSVTFDGTPQSGINEDVPSPTRWLCDYPRTKAIAEQRVLASNTQDYFHTCALRPHLIWGKGDPHLIPRVIARCKQGRLRRVGSGENLIDTVHVENAAYAHILALQKMLEHDRSASGKAYFITDAQPVGCWDWICMILRCAKLEPPKKSISLASAYRIGAVLESLYRFARVQTEPPMTRFVALQLGIDHYFDISAANKFLGYSPRENRDARIEELAADLARC